MSGRFACCTYHSTVADLDGLDHVQHQFGGLTRNQEGAALGRSVVDLPSEVGGIKRRRKVWDDTGHTEVQSLLGDVLEAESVLDDFLYEG